MTTFVNRLRTLLPGRYPLPQAAWETRHHVLLTLLWLHVPIIVAFGLIQRYEVSHVLLEAGGVGLVAALVSSREIAPFGWGRWDRELRASLAGMGLVMASAILTHLSGGYIEMHFHFFVMVAVMALYQDWTPFLVAIGFVAFHHGVIGLIAPDSVYNHANAFAYPWKWAAIHAFFIVLASAAAVATWRLNESARASEQQAASVLTSTLESTADGLLVVDRQGRISTYNSQFLKMWRIPPEVATSGDDERAIGFVLGQLTEPDKFVAKVRQLYDDPAAESYDVLNFKDGREFERYSKPQYLGTQIVGRVWSFRDTTERRRAENERMEARDRLREIDQLREVNSFKTQLLNTASHELNTPLTPLRLQLHVLKDGGLGALNEKQARAVHVLDRNVERLSVLVQNMLDVSRIQSARLTLKYKEHDLNALIEETIESFSEVAKRSGVQLQNDVRGILPIEMDPARIMQVLFNLVSNALKFTPGGGRITILGQREGLACLIGIRDTGIGIPAERIPKMFEPFTQVHDPMAVNVGGTGLGLFISRGIVEAHGGNLWVESDGAGRGTTFWMLLPAERAIQEPAPEPAVGAAFVQHAYVPSP